MTFGEYLASRSGLVSGTLMEHLEAIQGEGGGIVLSCELVFVDEDSITEVVETNNLELVEPIPNFIEEVGIIVELIEENEEEVDVISC